MNSMIDMPADLRELLDALCEESITDEQASRLERMLAEDEAARRFYVEYMGMYASLERYVVGDASAEHDEPPMAIAVHRRADRVEEEQAGTSASLNTVGGPVLARLWRSPVARVAAILLLATAAVVTFVTVRDHMAAEVSTYDLAKAAPQLPPAPTALLIDASGAEWADLPGTDEQMLTAGAELARGPMHLQSGSAQMILASGAVVTMLGDTEMELTGPNRVYLHRGRLVAHVSERAHGFTVDGPGLLVVDHGTEFGVSVSDEGVSEVHVFAGHVTASLVNHAGAVTQTTPLDADEHTGARLTPRQFSVRPIVADQRQFAASARPLPIFNTGRGLRLGQPDAHWTIEGPDVPRRTAVVSSNPAYVPNDPDSSQWLSFDPVGAAPAGAKYTFTTRFDMTGLDPATARLLGRFSVDNKVTAIRLNGREVAVPEHPWEWSGFARFSITEGFVPGVNTMEFVVLNSVLDGKQQPMALRVEFTGSALSNPDDTSTGSPSR
ncbi:MAG: hypothetical protein GC159_02940 [Phycisphaera sp.]|nr:hypothetical protein [Phycisphaera sp.]